MEILPPELILHLGPFLAPSAAANLILAAKRYYELLTPCLYEHTIQPADVGFGEDEISQVCLPNSSRPLRPSPLRFKTGAILDCMRHWRSSKIIKFFEKTPIKSLLAEDGEHVSILERLVSRGTVEVVRPLLERRIGLDESSSHDRSAHGHILECTLSDSTDSVPLSVSVLWYAAGDGSEEMLLMVIGLVTKVFGDEGLRAAMHTQPFDVLCRAADRGSLHGLRILLDHGADVTQCWFDTASESWVVEYASLDACKIIIDAMKKVGGDISRPRSGPGSDTPLALVVLAGNVQVAKLLIEEGADVEAKDSHGTPILQDAIRCGLIEIVELILDHCSANWEPADFHDLLVYAARGSHLEGVELIAGVVQRRNIPLDLDQLDHNNRHILDYMNYRSGKGLSFTRAIRATNSLVKMGASIDSQKYPFRAVTALHNLLYTVQISVNPAEYLTTIDLLHSTSRRGAPIQGTHGETPLHIAASRGLTEATKRILTHHQGDAPSLSVKNRSGHTALHAAAAASADVDVIRALVAAGLDPNARDDSGRTVLHVAALRSPSSTLALEELEKAGADVNAVPHPSSQGDEEEDPDPLRVLCEAGLTMHADCVICQRLMNSCARSSGKVADGEDDEDGENDGNVGEEPAELY